MSRIDLTKMFGSENAETFNKCSKAYEKGRVDAFKEILNEMRKSPFASEQAMYVKKYIEKQLKEKGDE